MRIKINNSIREIADSSTLADITSDLPQGGTATAVNGKLIPKELRASTTLSQDDEVLIISAAYGG